eukprot:m.102614 g.102614  ORF g.102614 m.102614 type:complete len:87 (-) comp15020_c0_seq1:1503-1763(-)
MRGERERAETNQRSEDKREKIAEMEDLQLRRQQLQPEGEGGSEDVAEDIEDQRAAHEASTGSTSPGQRCQAAAAAAERVKSFVWGS